MPSLVVIGPDVADQDGFRFHVHSSECGDRIKRIYHNIEFKDQWDGPCELSSIQDIVTVALGEEIIQSGLPWGEFEDQVRIFDCVPPIPLESPEGTTLEWDDDTPEVSPVVLDTPPAPIPVGVFTTGTVRIMLPQLMPGMRVEHAPAHPIDFCDICPGRLRSRCSPLRPCA